MRGAGRRPVAGPLKRLLLDTSVVTAGPAAIQLAPGERAAISVITLGELHAGVRLASGLDGRALRQARLASVRETFEPVLVDEAVAERYGEVLATARAKKRTSKATDVLIIATASATGRTLYTLDNAQATLARLAGVPVRA